jgi:hypothetical protein
MVPEIPGYEWLSASVLRHWIFASEDRVGSGGAVIPGNGFARAVIRVQRKILIDLNELDLWIESYRDTR